MKPLLRSLLALVILPFTLSAKDTKEKAPTGYILLEDIAKAQEKAKASKKLIAVIAKGRDDSCPHCTAAFSVSQATLRNDCVMVFTRSEGLRERTSSLTDAAKSGLSGIATNAWVEAVVFDPDMTKVIARLGRPALEANKKEVAEMKKAVSAARKELAAAK